jgi:hypothetical protein
MSDLLSVCVSPSVFFIRRLTIYMCVCVHIFKLYCDSLLSVCPFLVIARHMAACVSVYSPNLFRFLRGPCRTEEIR